MACTILCTNKKQFGIVVLVTCNVELQSTSARAQTVAPNLYWETPLNHNSNLHEQNILSGLNTVTQDNPESLSSADCVVK